jgi:ketosteroid isomerase-like protein
MSRENVEIARGVFDAWKAGDMDLLGSRGGPRNAGAVGVEPSALPVRVESSTFWRDTAWAMSGEDLQEFLLRGYTDFNRALVEPSGDELRVYLKAYFHEDAVYVNPPDAPEPGEHRGIEAIWRQNRRWVEPYPDLQIEPHEIRTNGDRAFVWVRFSGHGAGSDIPIEMEVAQVVTVQGGKISRIEAYTDRGQGLEAAGLSE